MLGIIFNLKKEDCIFPDFFINLICLDVLEHDLALEHLF